MTVTHGGRGFCYAQDGNADMERHYLAPKKRKKKKKKKLHSSKHISSSQLLFVHG